MARRDGKDVGNDNGVKEPQDQSEVMYSKSKTAMLKKQLGLSNDDTVVTANAAVKDIPQKATATASAAAADSSKKRHNDKKQRSGALPKPKQKKHPKTKNSKENSHQDHHRSRDTPSTESTAFTCPPSPDCQALSKQHGKKHRSPTRPTRPKPNQKKYFKKSTQKGKENVCNHDSNKPPSESSSPSVPSKHSDVNTAARPKPKQEKASIHLATQQGKESQKENHTTKSSDSTTSNPSAKHAVVDADTTIADVDTTNDSGHPENEKERVNRLLREAREQSAAAKEKKKSKKSKKYDKWLKEQEVEKSKRAKSWHEKISKENETVDLISQLIVSEFLRQNKDKVPSYTKEQVLHGSHASPTIVNESKHANNALYGGLKCRVKVAASDRQDTNGRQGTLRHWDADKEMFCVGLDTKKSADSDVHFLMPEILEATSAPRPSKADKMPMQGYSVEIKDLFNKGSEGIGCRFTLEKSAMDALRSAENLVVGLESFCLERDVNEHRLRLELEEERRQEEEHRKQEELDRKRRTARRAKEMAERERVKDQRHMDREEAARAEYERRRSHVEETFRLKFRLKVILFQAMKEGVPPEDLFDFLEGEGFDSNDFDSDDEDFFNSYSDFFENVDEEYDQQLREEKEEKSREMAGILGVDPLLVDERTLKVTYRKLALRFRKLLCLSY